MGNTGGDNRVEFGYRAPHAIWYNSPIWSGLAAERSCTSPGQNRSSSGDPTSEPTTTSRRAKRDCAGGNIPGSGALPPSCNDGSFGNLYSVSGTFTYGPLYVAAAYEHAQQRQPDRATRSASRRRRPKTRRAIPTTSATRPRGRSPRSTRSRPRRRSAASTRSSTATFRRTSSTRTSVSAGGRGWC